MNRLLTRIDTFIQGQCVPQRLAAAGLLRIALSLIMLAYLLLHFSKRAILWGPQGQIDWIEYTKSTADWLALYRYSPLPSYAELLYWLAVAVSALNLAGFMPRLMGLLFAVFASATLYRDWLAMDGGHSLLVVLSIYLVFADTSALSIVRRARAPKASQAVAIVHNAAMFAVSAQVCLMYYWAGFYKLFGVSWRQGTALYFVLRDHQFNFPGLSQLVYDHGMLIALGVYATLVFQGSFPFLMWVRRAKPAMVAIAISFHLAIAIMMGLITFSSTMIAADLALLSDDQLASLWRHIVSAKDAAGKRMRIAIRLPHAVSIRTHY